MEYLILFWFLIGSASSYFIYLFIENLKKNSSYYDGKEFKLFKSILETLMLLSILFGPLGMLISFFTIIIYTPYIRKEDEI